MPSKRARVCSPLAYKVLSCGREERHKEIICYANRIFMAFFPRNSVNFYCATWNARALNCYATVLLCNSIGHGRGLDRVCGCLNVLSPARDDFWPGYKAGTHFFILVFLAGSHFVSSPWPVRFFLRVSCLVYFAFLCPHLYWAQHIL